MQVQLASRTSNAPQLQFDSGAIDSISIVPYSRWDLEANGSHVNGSQQHVRFGSFLDAIDAFDSGFFAITSAEANLMDPQQRLLMEVGALSPLCVNECTPACKLVNQQSPTLNDL